MELELEVYMICFSASLISLIDKIIRGDHLHVRWSSFLASLAQISIVVGGLQCMYMSVIHVTFTLCGIAVMPGS